jgi:hypothetical protein
VRIQLFVVERHGRRWKDCSGASAIHTQHPEGR